MPKFFYVARTNDGQKRTGVAEAQDQGSLISRLQQEGLIITTVVSQESEAQTAAGEPKPARSLKTIIRRSRVSVNDMVLFSRQLGTMLDSGINLLRALDVILKQIESRTLYQAVEQVKNDVESGKSLAQGMARFPRIFSKLWVNLIETGEASGNMPLVLDRLARYEEARAAFQTKVITALIYPAILFIVAMGAIFFFVYKIIPTFAELFGAFGVELPAPTRFFIFLSKSLHRGIIPIVLGVIIISYLFRRYIETRSGRETFDIFKFKMPVLGHLFKAMAIETFTSELAMLLESGVPILYALDITQHSITNTVIEKAITQAKNNVREGKTLSEPLEASGVFPPMVVQMVSIGEEVGELPKMFNQISKFYESFIETFVTRLTLMFEPFMLVFIGGIIGFMVISMFLPIFNIATVGGMK
ncbi:MAG: type II secretion system F family protein [Candidatus Omnitrophota bacterium]